LFFGFNFGLARKTWGNGDIPLSSCTDGTVGEEQRSKKMSERLDLHFVMNAPPKKIALTGSHFKARINSLCGPQSRGKYILAVGRLPSTGRVPGV